MFPPSVLRSRVTLMSAFTSFVLKGDLLCGLFNSQGEAEWRAGARLHPGAHGVSWDGR